MNKKEKMVGSIAFKIQRPTELKFEDLYTGTIWQFPHKAPGGICGAVHPPIPEHGWFPAVINIKEKKAQVHANLDQTFTTPEEAANYLKI